MEKQSPPLATWTIILPTFGYVKDGDVKGLAEFGSGTTSAYAVNYPGRVIGASVDVQKMTIILTFTDHAAASEAMHDWYMVRARILAEQAAAQFGVDPNDIPF